MLNKIILITIFIITCNNSLVHAENDWKETCKNVKKIAASIMICRQRGWPLSMTLEYTVESEIVKNMIFEAYEERIYNKESMKSEAIDKFMNRHYLNCVKVLRK